MKDRRTPLMCRLLIRALPEQFRERYADDMALTFSDRLAAARPRGRLAVAALWTRTAADLVRAAAAERRRSSFLTVPLNDPASVRTADRGLMSGFDRDLRFALRQLRRRPAHALFVIATLAVGIGGTTAAFTVVSGVLLHPLPYPDSDRLTAVHGRFLPESGFDFPEFPLSMPEYLDYQRQAKAMQEVAAYQTLPATVGVEDGNPERVPSAAVTPNLFRLLRTPVLLGRDLNEADALPGAPAVVILNHGYWMRRYGGDQGIIGRTIRVTGVDRVVVGVARPGLAFPETATALWRPLTIDPANLGSRQSHSLKAIARLADDATLDAADAEMTTLMSQWKQEYPAVHTGHFLFLRPMLEDVVGPVSRVLVLLLAATGFVLLIVCANVSNFLLARGEGRLREMAIRSALGAERRRLVRLAGIESLALALLGGAAGTGIAWLSVLALRAFEGSGVPRAANVAVDGTALAFAAGVTMFAAIAFGLVPALRASSCRPQSALRGDDRTTSASASRQRFRRALVAIEVALTVVLVCGAGLMLQSMRRLLAVDPGFEPRGVLLASLLLPAANYPDEGRIEAFYRELIDRLAAAPGVAEVSAGTAVPLYSSNGMWDFELYERARPAAGEAAWNAAISFVRPGYFELLRIPVLRGRTFTAADDVTQPPVMIVNASLAEKFFPGEDPIGRRMRIFSSNTRPWATIVGIVRDVRDQDLETPERPMYYVPHSQMPVSAGGQFGTVAVMARTQAAPDVVTFSLREIVKQMDPALPLSGVRTFPDVLSRSYSRRTFATGLFAAFAAIGLVLGATGIYAVLAHNVARLTPEIGIRRALGATSSSIFALVLRQGLMPAVAGLLGGVVVAVGASRYLANQLFDVSPVDTATYGVALLGVLGLAVAACLLPARRALRVSPLEALRSS